VQHPRATDYVEKMIAWGEAIEGKHAYPLPSGLYFDVATVPDYGRLARAVTDADELAAEARIDSVEGKRHAADFALWRTTPAGENRQMEWDSPWGRGAPGWHIECSVMSAELLGHPFDIHTGGIDHREIHHPNEIAQNQAHACGPDTGARIWMHNNFLVDRRGKMSKSTGDFLTLQALVDRGYHPLAYRLLCLQAHYRSELEFTWEGLGAAFTRLKRMVMAVERLKADMAVGKQPEGSFPLSDQERGVFDEAIAGDLNTPEVLTSLEAILSNKKMPAAKRMQSLRLADGLLGLGLLDLARNDLRLDPKDAPISRAEIDRLIGQRTDARAAKDFAASDAIRDQLAAQGVEVMDGDPLGWDWKLG
jgi:cysteinyl-tRNA synthetase